MRRLVLIGGISLGVVLVASLASAVAPTWFPNHMLQMSALVVNGTPTPRFQVAHVADAYTRKTCVMVIMDTETGHLTATSVDPESCDARRQMQIVE